MPPIRPLKSTSVPHLKVMVTDDGSRTLLNETLQETYHSGCGAFSECLHVYLRNSGIEHKLRAWQSTDRPVRVLELGFGTGWGWLLTAAAAEAASAALEYHSLETQLLPVDVLEQIGVASSIETAIAAGTLDAGFRSIHNLEAAWLNHYRQAVPSEPHSRSTHAPRRIEWQHSTSNRLTIEIGLAQESLAQLCNVAPSSFDAVYFDAFSPSTNPELWHATMFASAKRLLAPEGRLVSYCVNGSVKRSLIDAGFTVTKSPGPPGGKREVLIALFGD